MISRKPTRGRGKRSSYVRLVRYLLDPKNTLERVDRVTITHCHSDDPMIAAIEVEAVQRLNQRAKDDKTYHFIFSFREGEYPSPEVLLDCEREFCSALGFAQHQRVSVVHRDTSNLHVHVAINKIHPTRLTIHTPLRDYWVRTETAKRLEDKHRLLRDRHDRRDPDDRPIGRAADMERHSGVESFAGWLQRCAAEDLCHAASWAELHRAAAAHGLHVQLRGNGCVITDGERAARASAVRRELSLGALQKKLGTFEAAATSARKRNEASTPRVHPANSRSAPPPPELRGKVQLLTTVLEQRSSAASSVAEPLLRESPAHVGALQAQPPRVQNRADQAALSPEERQKRGHDWTQLLDRLSRAEHAARTQAPGAIAASSSRDRGPQAQTVDVPNASRRGARVPSSRRAPPPAARAKAQPLALLLEQLHALGNKADPTLRLEAALFAALEALPPRAVMQPEQAVLSSEEKQTRMDDWAQLLDRLSRAAHATRTEVAAARGSASSLQRGYRARPLNANDETWRLFGLFVRERAARETMRRERGAQLRRQQQTDFERAIARWRLRRMALGLLRGTRDEKRFMHAAARLALRQELKALRHRAADERGALARATKRLAWADWLQQRARTGDAAAIDALRSRKSAPANDQGEMLAIAGTTPAQHASSPPSVIDTVTKTGDVIYRGALAGVRDDGRQLRVQGRVSPAVLAKALLLAASRYGSELRIEGDDAFKQAVVDVAVARRLEITFDDARLEARRKHVTETDHERQSQQRTTSGETHAAPSAARAAAGRQDGLRDVRVGELVRDGDRPKQLLPNHVRHDLARGASENRQGVRRADAAARRGLTGGAPPTRRGRLRTLSTLTGAPPAASRERANVSTTRTPNRNRSAPPPSVTRAAFSAQGSVSVQRAAASADAATARYVAERAAKRARGMTDILPHEPFDGRAGEFTFVGRRIVDGYALLLLRDNARILVVPEGKQTVTEELRIGTRVALSADGSVLGLTRARGRS